MNKLTYAQVRNFIDANRKLFKQDKEFKQEDIMSVFGVQEPDFSQMNSAEIMRASQSFQLQKLAAQTKVNRVLAQRGLYMSQYKTTNYRIKTASQTVAKVSAYQTAANQKLARRVELQAGITRAGSKWSRVKNSELPS